MDNYFLYKSLQLGMISYGFLYWSVIEDIYGIAFQKGNLCHNNNNFIKKL
jgi:hypothetical protein